MECKNCKHWQGLKGSKWGDCHRVLGVLKPELLTCYNLDADGVTRHYFKMPYDPHEFKYWRFNTKVANILKKAHLHLPKRVRIQKVKEEDVLFDQNGGQVWSNVTLRYMQTRCDYSCKED